MFPQFLYLLRVHNVCSVLFVFIFWITALGLERCLVLQLLYATYLFFIKKEIFTSLSWKCFDIRIGILMRIETLNITLVFYFYVLVYLVIAGYLMLHAYVRY